MRASAMFPTCRKHSEGFTLLELVIGIVVFTISLTVVLSLIVPQAEQTAEPFRQVKAAKLGQSLMNDILSRSYDENSDRSPPFETCNAKGNCSTTLGPEEASEDDYDDVDDYNGYTVNDVGGNYSSFGFTVTVDYDSDLNDSTPTDGLTFKRIDIAVTAPDGQVYNFSAYRGSY
ncbi:prepilin-type N-terminal cleavage/methylation domain-containing protein [Alteromonas sp. DY56-G5]|mgnify:FL=1|uniref:prepilin-type N-terminal cleavage/methylation domain-containing protein n=2 Tax=Alteromonas TaxID=226 RepID=UPI00066DBC50|nr:prepilin-type N-terminal cleavage/methylation domain-containing protein [Alteromonas macleodii]CAI3926650.1 MSHA pilin protein MshD [Alteromonas macleodii]VTP50207.1 MSHA pilin protein MshD [Alteromonas macleodii]|tara:strand:+ start:594 stop:1115 length:522 start_codon:yes stop_codon:yes gene_type:complete